MNWIMMNVITDALRKVTVQGIDKKTTNVDGRMFRIKVPTVEDKRKFVATCVKSVPALEIPETVFGTDEASNKIFRFRLVEFSERQSLLQNYEHSMPSEVYQVLVSKPVYTFIDLNNPIVEAFTKVAVASTLYSFNDVLRATSTHISDVTPGDIAKKLNMDLLMVGTVGIVLDVATKVI